jgi:hypothetical protein
LRRRQPAQSPEITAETTSRIACGGNGELRIFIENPTGAWE